LTWALFKISIPNDWRYKKLQGDDSFIGEIDGPNVELSFDCSNWGYASNLITEDDNNFNKYIIRVDTTNKYIIKTVYLEIAGKGMTGVYIHSRSSTFNFQMNGVNLSAQNEELALKAFKTIIIK
jgi:hypothetical protein